MFKRDIEKWLNTNGFKVYIMQDEEYGYNVFQNIIFIGNDDSVKNTGNLFKEFLKRQGCTSVINFNIHTLAFLHELGHYITVPTFQESELTLFATIKEMIVDLYNDEGAANLKYWAIPDELAANKWAINFINDHYEAAKQLDLIMTLAK